MIRKNSKINRKTFSKNEITVHAKCSVHPWMGAHIGVFNHHWFAKTDAKGQYNLPALPEGNYTVTFWHETLGKFDKNISVRKQNIELDFEFN